MGSSQLLTPFSPDRFKPKLVQNPKNANSVKENTDKVNALPSLIGAEFGRLPEFYGKYRPYVSSGGSPGMDFTSSRSSTARIPFFSATSPSDSHNSSGDTLPRSLPGATSLALSTDFSMNDMTFLHLEDLTQFITKNGKNCLKRNRKKL
jgi:hypothetical protein